MIGKERTTKIAEDTEKRKNTTYPSVISVHSVVKLVVVVWIRERVSV